MPNDFFEIVVDRRPAELSRARALSEPTRNPRPRYNVGFIAGFGPLGRALTPTRLVDFITRRDLLR